MPGMGQDATKAKLESGGTAPAAVPDQSSQPKNPVQLPVQKDGRTAAQLIEVELKKNNLDPSTKTALLAAQETIGSLEKQVGTLSTMMSGFKLQLEQGRRETAELRARVDEFTPRAVRGEPTVSTNQIIDAVAHINDKLTQGKSTVKLEPERFIDRIKEMSENTSGSTAGEYALRAFKTQTEIELKDYATKRAAITDSKQQEQFDKDTVVRLNSHFDEFERGTEQAKKLREQQLAQTERFMQGTRHQDQDHEVALNRRRVELERAGVRLTSDQLRLLDQYYGIDPRRRQGNARADQAELRVDAMEQKNKLNWLRGLAGAATGFLRLGPTASTAISAFLKIGDDDGMRNNRVQRGEIDNRYREAANQERLAMSKSRREAFDRRNNS